MKKAKKSPGLKPKLQKTQAKAAATLYGNPAKNLKIIAVTGTAGKDIVSQLIHKILLAHKIPTTLILSPPSSPLTHGNFHKLLSKSHNSGATHVVVEAPASALKKHVFHGVPVHIATLTSLLPPQPGYIDGNDYAADKSILFSMQPHFIILNRDDPSFEEFSKFPAKTATTSFGQNKESNVRINRSKLYKKGTEANLTVGPATFDVATFVTGDQAVSYMAAATAVASLLDVPVDTIIDGIASYEP